MFDYLVFLFEETTRITSAKESEPLELLYAQDLMDCLESTSSHLAEFESLEVMVFITEKILDPKKEVSVDIMFRCLYTVALSYKNRFPIPMYKPLLYLISDYPTTEMGQIIFHTLLDVHGNLTTVDLPSYNILLRNKPYCRGNMLLIRTYDLEIYAAVLKALEAADFVKSSHSKTVYRTLLAMGAYQEPSTILNYIACMYLLQSLAVSRTMGASDRARLLIGSLGLFIATTDLTDQSSLADYGRELIAHREIHSPGMTVNAQVLKYGVNFSACCLLESHSINCRLRNTESLGMNTIVPVIDQLKQKLKATVKIEGESMVTIADTLTSFYEDNVPIIRSIPEDLTVEAMKMVLAAPAEESLKMKTAKMMETKKRYATCTLEDIARSLENPVGN
uniref:Protein EFR3 cmp44E n=2 Tax=Lygus hesperus TaxID=30085 RepID=A0A0A9W3I7_LYGHE